ncbi:hypothetical protein ABUK29_21980, partial [Xanthomonas citri pv. mangiferaeindicae]
MKNSHTRALRGDVQGWSHGATRRNTEFLMSIREDRLTGAGVTVLPDRHEELGVPARRAVGP